MSLKLIDRLKKQWHDRDLTWRLIELGEQSFNYSVTTLVLIGASGAVAYRLLPLAVAQPGIFFLALVYLLILLITISHNFTANHERYLLNNTQQILDELRDFAAKQGCG